MPEKERIAFLTPEFPTDKKQSGGLASYLSRIGRALLDQGHEVEVICRTLGPERVENYHGIRVDHVRRSTGRSIKCVQLAKRLAPKTIPENFVATLRSGYALHKRLEARNAAKAFSIVQCTDLDTSALFLKPKHRYSLVMRLSNVRARSEISYLESMAKKICIQKVRRRYAPSHFLASQVHKNQGLHVDVIRPPLARPPEANLRKIDFQIPQKFLFHFGVLGKSKGTDIVIAALPMVWKKIPEFNLVLAGKERQIGFLEQMRSLSSIGEDQRLTWLGPKCRDEIYFVLQRATATVCPSRVDNLPNTVIESIQFEKPVIGTNGASIDELVEDGLSGTLVPPNNPQALAKAMIDAWNNSAIWSNKPYTKPKVISEMLPSVACRKLIEYALDR